MRTYVDIANTTLADGEEPYSYSRRDVAAANCERYLDNLAFVKEIVKSHRAQIAEQEKPVISRSELYKGIYNDGYPM